MWKKRKYSLFGWLYFVEFVFDCYIGVVLIVYFIYGEVLKRVNMYGMGYGKDKVILICFISIVIY